MSPLATESAAEKSPEGTPVVDRGEPKLFVDVNVTNYGL